MYKPCGVPVERLFGGRPVLAPTDFWWENGVTFNTAAFYLERSPENDPLIMGLLGVSNLDDPILKDGVVALHYRARPKHDPDYAWNRSFVGLALFTPEMDLLKRFNEPVIASGPSPQEQDYMGVEDPRITRIGDTFYAVYCGAKPDTTARYGHRGRNCMARSKDLIHWEKMGAIKGDPNKTDNKDGVLFPGPIDGRFYLLHRPWGEEVGTPSDQHTRLAVSDAVEGPWHDLGIVLRAVREKPDCRDAWNGAGSVPIPLSDKRYLVIYHTGNRFLDGGKEYDLDVAIFDFERLDPARPESIVESVIEPLMVPETDWETKTPFSDSEPNSLFTCGSYEYNGWIYIVYGGGDTYIMAARLRKDELLKAMDTPPKMKLYLN